MFGLFTIFLLSRYSRYDLMAVFKVADILKYQKKIFVEMYLRFELLN